MPPPKKSKKGLIIGIAVVLLVVIIGCAVVGVLVTRQGSSTSSTTSGNAATATTAPTATATASVPAGFQKFSNDSFSIYYPADWEAKPESDGGEQFSSSQGQVFQVNITAGAGANSAKTFDDAYCRVIGKQTADLTTVTIGGQQWTREECEDEAGTFHSVVEAVNYKGQLFSIAYLSLKPTFDLDKAQYYSPMEQSFTFLG